MGGPRIGVTDVVTGGSHIGRPRRPPRDLLRMVSQIPGAILLPVGHPLGKMWHSAGTAKAANRRPIASGRCPLSHPWPGENLSIRLVAPA